MSIELTTSATALRPFRDALASLGADWKQILRICGIAPEKLDDCEARIAQHRIERIWTVACEVTRDPCIGLHAGEHVHPRAVNLFGYLLLSSETVGEGVERVARYQQALTGVPWISIQPDESSLYMRVGMQHGDREIRAIHAEYVAGLALQMMSWVSETRIEPAEVRFAHAPRGEPAEYERILRSPVKFEADQSELVMSSRMRHKPSMHPNSELARVHEELATELLARQVRDGVAHSVRRALAHQLESGPPELASVARELAMSPRSLQRRLADRGDELSRGARHAAARSGPPTSRAHEHSHLRDRLPGGFLRGERVHACYRPLVWPNPLADAPRGRQVAPTARDWPRGHA